MPKLPVLSGQQVVKALERVGCVAVRQRGSHVVMRRDSTGCELKAGTLANIIKQAGVAADVVVANV